MLSRVDNGSVEGGGEINWGLMAGVAEGVKLLKLRNSFHTMKLSAQNSFW